MAKSMEAVLRDLARATGRRITITGDETNIRMQIVSVIAEAKSEGIITWAQIGQVLGVQQEPKLIKKTIRDIARAAQDELARRAMATAMTRPSPARACVPSQKEI
jgi:hypothetical protein